MGLIVDSFAGGGGASLGIEMALGRSPDIAINHNEEALAMHMANHPASLHLSKNIWRIDPLDHVKGRAVDLAWFSPDCKHFSKAKGGKPVARNIRDLAWIVVLWARRVKPAVIILENVEEFQTWGPLDGDDMPCQLRKGQTFKRWQCELRKLGYRIEWRELRACDYGAPTIRKRLFLIARCDGRPIVWPEPTHGKPGDPAVIAGRKLPWRTAAECIDWSLPCPSIFLTKEAGRLIGVNRPLAEATMARIAKGVKRYVIDAAEPFIVRVAHGETDRNGKKRGRGQHSLGEPLPTILASPEFSLIAPVLAGCGGRAAQSAPRPLTVPMATATAKADSILVAAFLAQHNLGRIGNDLRLPVSTVMQSGSHQQLVAAHLINLKGSDRRDGPVDAPAPSMTAGGLHIAEVRAFLLKYYGNEIQGHDLSVPIGTVTTKDRFGLVMVQGEPYEIVDIGMRMLGPRELFRAQGFPDTYVIEAPFNGKTLSKTAQVRCCGNSVSPVMAKALVAANCTKPMRAAA